MASTEKMTVYQIKEELLPEKPISRKQVYVYLNRLGIHPVGSLPQRPQQYPEESAEIIRCALGLPPRKKRR